MTLMARGKEQRKTMTAVARELLGFLFFRYPSCRHLLLAAGFGLDPDGPDKSKNFPNKEKAKTNQPMNNVIQFEDRGQPQPEQAQRRILGFPMRQAQPDSRR
jgi:hypothetical protein